MAAHRGSTDPRCRRGSRMRKPLLARSLPVSPEHDQIGTALFRLFGDCVGDRMSRRFAEHDLTLDRPLLDLLLGLREESCI